MIKWVVILVVSQFNKGLRNMLTAVVLQLRALTDGQIQGSTGRAIHGFWLKQWQETNPVMSKALHQDYPIKPFTLSPLMGLPLPQRGQQTIPAGQTAWFRLTTLHPALSDALFSDWLPNLPDTIQLAQTQWAIEGQAEDHPWSANNNYDQLAMNCMEQSTSPWQWRLDFQTPTTFRVGEKYHLPFPLPELLVTSWLRRWQAFSSWSIDTFTLPDLRQNLFINNYQLKTVPMHHGRRLAIGCVGQLTLQTSTLPLESRSIITMLARYAFFCGSGYHTTQGMGLTRLL